MCSYVTMYFPKKGVFRVGSIAILFYGFIADCQRLAGEQ